MKFWKNKQPMFEGEGANAGGGSLAPAAPAPVVEIQAPVIESAPAPAPQPAAPVSTEQRVKDLWDKANVVSKPEPSPVDNPAPQAPAAPDNPAAPAQPEKIMNKYDTVGDLVKAHQSLQTTYGKQNIALTDLNKVVEKLKADNADLTAKLQTANPNPQQPQAPAQAADDFAGMDAEAILAKLYEDPVGVLTKIAERAADNKLKPLEGKLNPIVERNAEQQNLQLWDESLTKFAGDNPDVSDYTEGMREYINDNNLQDSTDCDKVLKNAYTYAKGLKSEQIAAESASKIAESEAKVKELEAKLQAGKDETIREYLQGVRTTQNQIPNTISGHSNNGAPAMPPVSLKGKPMSEVHKAASDFLFGSREGSK